MSSTLKNCSPKAASQRRVLPPAIPHDTPKKKLRIYLKISQCAANLVSHTYATVELQANLSGALYLSHTSIYLKTCLTLEVINKGLVMHRHLAQRQRRKVNKRPLLIWCDLTSMYRLCVIFNRNLI